jgi:hypothetical protein
VVTKPNFFIIGAPKCGTTSLAAWLSQHREVFIPPEKELNFFDDDHHYPVRLTLRQYEKLFARASEKAVGDASVWYLYSWTAVPNILEYQPNARFIVCLRDPVEMAFSLHHQQIFSRNEDIFDFRTAWQAQEERRNGAPVKAHERSHLYYGDVCKLGEQVERLLSRTQRVHFVRLDEVRQDPRAAFSAVLDFLELAQFDPDLTARNQAKERRSLVFQKSLQLLFRMKHRLGVRKNLGALTKLYRWNTRPAKWNPDPEFAAELASYFREDSEKLARLISAPEVT